MGRSGRTPSVQNQTGSAVTAPSLRRPLLQVIVERLRDAIHPDASAGEPPLLPILNRYRPVGKTSGVDFPTTRPVTSTMKSHINLVVQHSDWEAQAAQTLDACDLVKCYARNDHLGLVIPYEFMGTEHSYEPDFLVRLVNNLNLLLEIKGYEVHNPELNNAKHGAAKRWVTAVNNLGEFGRWDFLVVRDMIDLLPALAKLAPGKVPAQVPSAVVDPLFPAIERDRWLCALVLELIKHKQGYGSTAYLDALMLAEMPADCKTLLLDSDRPAFNSAFKEVKRILTGGKLPWRTIRQLLTQNASIVAGPSDAFDPGAVWAD